MKNSASIYFDYNLPVTTNRENTVVQSIILPAKLTGFTANRDGVSNKLVWNFTMQESMSNFEIERSTDGLHYTLVGKVNAAGNGTYTFTDNQPAKEVNYYRIKIINKDGSYEYSAIRTINNTGSFAVSIYPNPVGNILSLKIDAEKKENLQLQIADVEGKVLLYQQLRADAGSAIKTINTTSLKGGSYFVKITSATKEQWVMKFEKL